MRRRSSALLRWLAVLALPVLALSVYGSAAAAPPQQAPTCRWTKLANGENRTEVTLVGLPGKGVLAFGGAEISRQASSVKDDVHLLDLSGTVTGGTWSELNPSGAGPGDRAEHASVYRPDPGGSMQMVTFGGIDTVPTGGGTLTWQSPLLAGGSALDGRLENLAPLTVQRDTYVLDIDTAGSAAWSKVGAQGQTRAGHSAVYDPVDDAMIVFGGRKTDDANSAENSTLRLTLGGSPAWQPLSGGGTAPSKRFAHTAIYDPVGKRMIVFGGTIDWRSGLNDTYALDLSNGWGAAQWSKLTPTGTIPQQRFDHGATYVPDLRWMVIFGGTRNGQGQLEDAYALDLSVSPPNWIELLPIGTKPTQLQSMGAAYSSAGNYSVFYGGQTGNGTQRSSLRAAWGLKCESANPTPTATESPSATPTIGGSATPSATTAPTDVTVTGIVTQAGGGPVAGATVAVGLSVPHQPFSGVTGADGRYSLLVPAVYITQVDRIMVSAGGFEPITQPVTGLELQANPVRDFTLTPSVATPTATGPAVTPATPTPTSTMRPDKFWIYLPILLKGYIFERR